MQIRVENTKDTKTAKSFVSFVIFVVLTVVTNAADAPKPWSIELELIEACSCDLFCTCYLSGHASHQGTGDPHRCNFNIAAQVKRGKYGDADLTGLRFWSSGDLGPHWSHGRGSWLVLTFEPRATKLQREGIVAALTQIIPVRFDSYTTDQSEISWEMSADKERAYARLRNGKGEIILRRFVGIDPKKPTEMHNLTYFGADWNSPFVLYYSDHYYNGFGKRYKLQKANGFTITVKASRK